MSALFSDAVEYRFRLRPVAVVSNATQSSFVVSEREHTFSCRFSPPVNRNGDRLEQEGTCTASSGRVVSFRVNDEKGGEEDGLRVFAGVRMDPFFFEGVKALQTIVTRKLSFEAKGSATVFRQNVLSIVIELDVARTLDAGDGPLFAIVGETITTGTVKFRLERFGRPEIKNFLLLPKEFDTVNRDIELRDLYNQEDAFKLGPAYSAAFRARMNANLGFWDGLDGKSDWLPDGNGVHPLTEFLLSDFMVIDISKPFAEHSYLEIEQTLLRGLAHQTCGGRWLDDDSIDTFLTFLINAGNGPRISDGVDHATVPASLTFPYLAPPEPNPPAPKAPPIVPL